MYSDLDTSNLSSLAYLQSIYRDPLQATYVRMKAAIAALPFECPKLAVTAVVEGSSDFATRLELARARSAKVIEARAEAARAIPPRETGREPPVVPDRRFRQG
jgi:hypothetical protein